MNKITTLHSLEYDKKYLDGQNLKKNQFAEWLLKKNVEQITKDNKIIKGYENLYFTEPINK